MFKTLIRKTILAIAITLIISLTVGIPAFAQTLKKGEPIVIGAPVPRAIAHGQSAEEAMILAVEEVNAAGGIKLGDTMRPIKLEIIDTRDQEPGVPTSDVLLALEKLILGKKPLLILGGPNMSEAAMAALDLYAKHKALSIHSIGAWTPAWHAKVGKDLNRYKYSFKIAGHVGFYMNEIDRLLQGLKGEFGFNKIYTTVADAAHCRAAADAVDKLAPKGGWEVVGKEIHPLGTTDFSMLMRSIKQSGAQVIFVWDHISEAVMMARQWYDLKVPALPIGVVDDIGDPGMWERTNGKVGYIIGFGGEAGTLPGQEITPLTKHFFNAYKKRWGREPRDVVCTPSYFGIYMVKEVIERAQSLDRDTLVAAIENVDMVTISGRLRFDKSNHQAIYGDNPKETLLCQFFQWQNGKRISAWPKSISTGKIQIPPWMK
jgi:branched-chain amino acid transport system substrate-binding protein